MKQYVHYVITLSFLLCCGAATTSLQAQGGVFNQADPVVTYDSTKPPVKPASNQVGKWVRTSRLSWNTSAYKCYIYNNMAFRLRFPKNYDSTKQYPLLLFLHGKGETGSIYDNEYQLYHGGKEHNSAIEAGKFDGFLLYPQSQNENWSSGSLSNIKNLIENVMIPLKMVDPFRVYVDGLSAGGSSTWDFLRRYSKLVAAITPISASSYIYADSVLRYRFTPIYHFQGSLDDAPLPSTSKGLGKKILAAGGNYKYKEFLDRGHDCWNKAWADGDYFPFYSRAHKANPWPLYGRTEFCQGEAFTDTLGVTAGFDGYEWRKNGVLIPGATANTFVVTEYGTYDCRIKRGTEWSIWSPRPVIIGVKAPTVQPLITVTGSGSNVIPALDGGTSVPLEAPDGYATYNWQKEGSTTVLSTTRYLTASTAGNYKIKVTEQYGCPATTTTFSVMGRVQAENYTAMKGIDVTTTGDPSGGGLNVGYINQNDWMEYIVNMPVAGTYGLKVRVASPSTGGKLQVKKADGTVLATVNIPNTGGWHAYQDVNTTVNLTTGLQNLRIQSTASAGWNFNWFDLTAPGLTNTDGFSMPFPVVNASGSNGPDAVTNLTATATSKTSIQLSWNQTASPAFNETGFELYEATAAGGPYTYKGIIPADATGTTRNDLPSGVTFYYKVRAVNNNAAAAAAGPASATTLVDNSAPTTPTTLRLGTITKSSVELLWNAASDDVGVFKYDVYVNGEKRYVAGNTTKFTVYNLSANKDYTFRIKARDAARNTSPFSNEVTAHTLTGTIKQDPSMTPLDSANFSVYINLNAEYPASSPWSNTNALPTQGAVFKNFKNYAGNYSGISMTLVDNFSGYNPGGMITGNNSGVYPDNVMRSMYYCDKGVVATVRMDGLSIKHKYSFVFFGSRNGTGDRTSVYTIGSQSVSLNASNNTTNTVQIDNIMPDENGSVTFTVSLGSTAMYAYMNSLVLKAYALPPSAGSEAANATTLAATNNFMEARAFPNPVQSDVITLGVPLSRSVSALTVQLTDASGSILSTQVFNNLIQGTWQQNISLYSTLR